MPQKRKSRGFTHVKTGRGKVDRGGGGRGHRGRRSLTGYLPSEEESKSPQNNADDASPQSPVLSPEPDVGCSRDSADFRAAWSTNSECSTSDQSDLESRGTPSPSPSATKGFSAPPLSQHPLSSRVSTSQAFVSPSVEVVMAGLNLLRASLPPNWTAIADHGSYHILLLSRGNDKTTQRNVNITFNGLLKVTVHRRPLQDSLNDEIKEKSGAVVVLSESTCREFIDRVLSVVNFVRSFEICAGTCDKEYKHFWIDSESGSVDKNPYGETRYDITYRSTSCHMLVPVRKWKCVECYKASERFRHKVVHENIEDYHQNTPNIYLTEEQMKKKMHEQQKKINAGKKKIARMQAKIQELLKEHGVHVDQDVSDCLEEAVKSATNLSPEVQQLRDLFLQQQHKAASVKGKTGMRWHPAMIRFAILIKSHSSAAYDAIRQSGFISLPGERTLFDYTHTIPQMHGINTVKIERLSEKVATYEKNHQHFHNLLMDEIHISEKLVFSKSTGEMLGYVKLSEAEKELEILCQAIQNKTHQKEEPQIAKKILAYMVKGITNDVKEVVAAYTTHSPTKEFLFDRTWDVITHCELAGIHIVSVVCDGSAVNRGFIQMHIPSPGRELKSGVVYACKNLCAPDRDLFFFSDPPHLLKTLRNCFAKSGTHPKATRKLAKGGQLIVWSTIIDLFLDDHEDTLRSSHKLNAQNVYLNSYSCMNVALATQVLSNSVSVDLATRNYPHTSETVTFIKKCNDFFDCMNGGHSAMGLKAANDKLNSYRSSTDPRFGELDEFVSYLRAWDQEIKSLPGLSAQEKKRMFIPPQTFQGIEMSVNALRGAVEFMLDVVKAKFINARVFNQDPLEQYFGKQRASIGGSRAPSEGQFYENDLKISIHRDCNVRKRSGNVEAVNTCMRITDEPLPKRKKGSYKRERKSV